MSIPLKRRPPLPNSPALQPTQRLHPSAVVLVGALLAAKLPVPGSADCYTCCAQYGTTAKTNTLPPGSYCRFSFFSSCGDLRDALTPSTDYTSFSSAWCFAPQKVNNPLATEFVHCFGDDSFES